MIYLIVLLLSFFFAYYYDIRGKKAYNKIAYQILFFFAVGVAGCRYMLGGDSIRYFQRYDFYPTFDSGYDFFSYSWLDPLWMVLNAFTQSIWDDFVFFQFVHAFILNGVIFYFIDKKSKYKFSCVLFYFLIYYFYFNMEILREALAICCFIFCIPFFQKQNWLKYYIIASIAFLFHSSALIICFFPLFRNVKYSFLRVLILSVSLYFFFDGLLYFLNLVSINPLITQKLETYADMSLNFNAKMLKAFLYIILPMGFIYFNNSILKKKNEGFEPFFMMYFFVASISLGNTAFGGRLINYMMPLVLLFYINVLFNVIESKQLKVKKILFSLSFILLPFIFHISYYLEDTSYVLPGSKKYFLWYPYTSVFSINDQEQKRITSQREYYADELMRYQNE